MSESPKVVVTGSVAFDYLMRFPGKFQDVVVPDRMHRLSVSFLVDEMRRVRGGVAPNIAYGLALFGMTPAIFATAGQDAADYRAWLGAQGCDVSGMKLCDDVFTASFFVSTDEEQNQIATFYAGAMAKASELTFRSFAPGSVALALICPSDPTAMRQHAAECRELGIPFVYDPSQQVARLDGDDLLAGLEGAAMLIGNEYELGVIEKKTGLSEAELAAKVPVLVITRGEEGATIALRGGSPEEPGGARTVRVPAAKLRTEALDPTGVGDAFRSGLVASRLRGLPWEEAGKVGAVAAVLCLETLGPQPRRWSLDELLERYAESFGKPLVGPLAERLRGLAGTEASRPAARFSLLD
ncbi:MAG: carbohydrate kinase family protein [Thermoanaerobaculia bacterium]|jgi:adenosine kinase|nr:carbohydrate kinase family protein [Thermoanaerobaculia bacterium]